MNRVASLRLLIMLVVGVGMISRLSVSVDAQGITSSDDRKKVLSSGFVESWKVDETTRGVLLDNGAELQMGNERLTADRIIAWIKTVPSEESGGPIPESAEFKSVYAEKNVLYWKEQEFLQADRLYLNRLNHTGVAKDVTYRTFDKNRNVPVVVRSDRLIQTGRENYEATGVEFTTCDYAEPHYSLYADSLHIWHDRENNETSISAAHVLPQFRGVPFGYWPFLYAHSDFDLGPLKRVQYGSNDRFGQFVETLWGFEFSSVKRNEDGRIVRDKNGNRVYNYDIDLDVRLDYRERRGPAIGPEIDYKLGRDHDGFLYGYVMNDIKGPNPDNDFDQQFLPQIKERRGRLWWFHRYDLLGMEGDVQQLRLDTEVNNISDRHFMEEFFEDEFKTGKDRETYSYLRYVDGNEFGSVLARYRLNSFQTQTEYLPSVGYSVHGEPVEDTPLVYSSDTSMGYIRRTRDRRSNQPDVQTGRFDTYQEVAYPFSPGPIEARLFTGGRFTHYENDPATDRSVNRHVFSGGAQLYDQLHKVYPLSSDDLGLDGLRHIVSWDVRYTNNFDANRAPTAVPQFDVRDPVGEHEEIYFELRNRFQTRAKDASDENNTNERSDEPRTAANVAPTKQSEQTEEESVSGTHEFLDIGAAIEYYPNPARDRQRPRVQNHLAPASWITTVQSPQTGAVRDDDLSLLHLDFDFSPNWPISLRGDYDWNIEASNLDASTTKLSFSPTTNFTTSFTHSFIRDLTETVTGRMRASLSDHWSVSGSTTYDLRRDRSQNLQFGLGYKIHDFTIGLSTNIQDGRLEENEYVISVTPNFASTNIFDYDIEQE